MDNKKEVVGFASACADERDCLSAIVSNNLKWFSRSYEPCIALVHQYVQNEMPKRQSMSRCSKLGNSRKHLSRLGFGLSSFGTITGADPSAFFFMPNVKARLDITI